MKLPWNWVHFPSFRPTRCKTSLIFPGHTGTILESKEQSWCNVSPDWGGSRQCSHSSFPTHTYRLFCPLPVSALAQIQGSTAAAPAAGLPEPCSLHTAPVKACSSFLHVLFPQQWVPELPIKPLFCHSASLPLPRARGRSLQTLWSCFIHAGLNNQFCWCL